MKDIMGAALLGELLGALARSSALRTSLGGVPAEEAEAVVRRMVGEVERLAAEGAAPAVPPIPQKPALFATPPPPPRKEEPVRKPFPAPAVPAPAPAPPVSRPVPEAKPIVAAPAVVAASPRVTVSEPVIVAASPRVTVSEPAVVAASPRVTVSGPAVVAASPRVTVSEPAADHVRPAVVPKPHGEIPRPAPVAPPVPPPPAPEVQRPVVTPAVTQRITPATPAPARPHTRPAPAPAPPAVPAETFVPEPPSPLRTPSIRVQAAFDDETAFVLAAALIPLQDTPSPHPFGIGVDGVERGSEIFAFDHAGMRFFLSTLKNQEASVSRTGMLLLGKQESIKHRNVHESMVNQLRLRSLILPAETGTVVFGRNDLIRRVDLRRDALFEILVGLSTLSTWRVHASVLDGHVQKMLPAEASPARGGRHDSERARVSSATRKTDIKMLERLLNREKKLAESILQRLAGAADSHTVESIVGLGSGSSEDWKPILKAAFEVPAGRFTRFAQAVVECQEANAMFEPMLTVVGGPGSFSLSM